MIIVYQNNERNPTIKWLENTKQIFTTELLSRPFTKLTTLGRRSYVCSSILRVYANKNWLKTVLICAHFLIALPKMKKRVLSTSLICLTTSIKLISIYRLFFPPILSVWNYVCQFLSIYCQMFC